MIVSPIKPFAAKISLWAPVINNFKQNSLNYSIHADTYVQGHKETDRHRDIKIDRHVGKVER